MEKERTLKIVVLVTLVIAVFGVAIGFAAWSATLQIMSVTSSVSSVQDDASFKNLIKITNNF